MAIAATPIAGIRPDIWHRKYGPSLAFGLVLLPFAAILLWASSAPPVDSRTLAASIRETAAVVDEHAGAMIRIGERVAAAAQAANDKTWTAYGAHVVSDGRSLERLAASLRDTAVVAEADPMHTGRIEVAAAILEGRWERLRLDGRATALHGSAMVEQARTMSSAPRSIVTAADLAELESVSRGMVEAGERSVRIAETLLSSTSQIQRWLGVSR